MDSTCFPKAQAADREAVAAAGISYRFAQLPLLMKAVYGSRPPRHRPSAASFPNTPPGSHLPQS